MEAASARQWWGNWKLVEGEVRFWRIGPLSLWVQRLADEWRIAHEKGPDPLDTACEVAVPSDAAELEQRELRERFVWGLSDGELSIVPALADRPLVTRPELPFTLLSGGEVQIYVSSPVWVRLAAGPERTTLRELPAYRPTDTWFGPSTMIGELLYASRTHCRTQLEQVPLRPHRAITPVSVRNQVDAALTITRMSVPLPNLSLFAGSNGSLWTPSVVITRDDPNAELAQLEIREGSPAEMGAAELVAQPRTPAQSRRVFRAFEALF